MALLANELLQTIAIYLDVNDVNACSLVCLRWRNALNINKIWSQIYFKTFGTGKHSLDRDYSKVTPKFSVPPIVGRLTKICSWRVKYLEMLHVVRNWKGANYSPNTLLTDVTFTHLDCDDDILVILYSKPRAFFQVYDLNHLTLIQEKVECSLSGSEINFFHLSNGVLIIIQDLLLQVYRKNNENKLELTKRYIFCKDIDVIKIPELSEQDITHWYSNRIHLFEPANSVWDMTKKELKCVHNGKYFVGTKCEDILVLHIWDLDGDIKLPDCSPLIEGVRGIELTLIKSKIYLKLIVEENLGILGWCRTITKVIAYNVESREFLPLDQIFPNNAHVHFTELFTFTICAGSGELHIWDSIKGNMIQRLFEPSYWERCNSAANFDCPISIFQSPYFILATGISGLVIAFNIFDCTSHCINSFYVGAVYGMYLIQPSMILLLCDSENCGRCLELWEISGSGCSCKLQVFDYPGTDMFVLSSMAKLVLKTGDTWGMNESELMVLDFW